jgi:hypothetical protein
MKEEKLFKVKYRWRNGNTYHTQVVDETTLEKMKKDPFIEYLKELKEL